MYKYLNVLSVFIYAVTCAWSLVYSHMCQLRIYNCYCFFIPASKWQFESLLWLLEFHVPLFTLYMGSWWLQQSLHNLCTVTCNNTCLPQTHNTRLCWALPYKYWSKVCHLCWLTQQPETVIMKYAWQTVPVKDQKWWGKSLKGIETLRLHFVGDIV